MRGQPTGPKHGPEAPRPAPERLGERASAFGEFGESGAAPGGLQGRRGEAVEQALDALLFGRHQAVQGAPNVDGDGVQRAHPGVQPPAEVAAQFILGGPRRLAARLGARLEVAALLFALARRAHGHLAPGPQAKAQRDHEAHPRARARELATGPEQVRVRRRQVPKGRARGPGGIPGVRGGRRLPGPAPQARTHALEAVQEGLASHPGERLGRRPGGRFVEGLQALEEAADFDMEGVHGDLPAGAAFGLDDPALARVPGSRPAGPAGTVAPREERLPDAAPAPPEPIYRARQEGLAAEAAHALARGERLANARLVCGALALGAWLGAGAGGWSPHLAWLAVAAFVPLVIAHGRAARRERAARLLLAHYARREAVRAGEPSADPAPGAPAAPAEHPYARDLDLFGPHGLLGKVALGVTGAGDHTLAAWLLAGAAPEECVARQEAVRALSDGLDLRERYLLTATDVGRAVDGRRIGPWAKAPPAPVPGRGWRAACVVTAALATGSVAAWLAGALAFGPAVLAVLPHALLLRALAGRVEPTLRALYAPATALGLLGRLLELIERAPAVAPWLGALKTRLGVGGEPARRALARLERRAAFAASRANPVFLPLSGLLGLGVHLAASVEAWRRRVGPHLGAWLEGVGAFEALLSLAAWSHERRDHSFPRFVAGARLAARGVAHPLLPPRRAVRNDVALGGPDEPRALVVSGSNMSGKSTLLRALGVNVVLARAGAPVCAHEFVLGPLALGASLEVRDSLAEGHSRFYAELLRLRQVTGLLRGPEPVLFLLDELLQGTNSHDRAIGARRLVEALLDGGAIGLVTTHDLALGALAVKDPARLANVHFEDRLDEGRLTFDYRLRPGIVTRSNALELMRAVGLLPPDRVPPAGPP